MQTIPTRSLDRVHGGTLQDGQTASPIRSANPGVVWPELVPPFQRR